jgi:CubicO group peptidase (beta-lactamase class C family)
MNLSALACARGRGHHIQRMRISLFFRLFQTHGAAATFILSCGLPAAAADWTPDKSARVDQLISYVREGRTNIDPLPIPGISLAIGIDDRLVLAKGYGEARPGIPADEHTVYRVGSITKQFTAAAILRLIESKREIPGANVELSLQTPLTAIFENTSHWTLENAPPITVQNLLTMTSSLPNFTAFPLAGNDPFHPIPAETLLAAIKQFSPSQSPNHFEYTNTGYFLLAQVIERMAGGAAHSPEDYRQYLKSIFFGPLRMEDSGFIEDMKANPKAAWPTYRRKPPFTQPDWLEGSADMTSSALDLFHWNRAFMDATVVAPKIHDEMTSDAIRVGPQDWYGMGLFVRHKDDFDEFAHSGTVPGFTSLNAVFQSKKDNSRVSITLLANKDELKDLNSLATEIFYLTIGR